MDRQQTLLIAEALNEAIWIRNNADSVDRAALMDAVRHLGKYQVFSSRQISAITNGVISHTTISKVIDKPDKTGGNLNAGTLDLLRAILYSRADGRTDYNLIRAAVGAGTSQGMVSKVTGINQSTISKVLRRQHGIR